MQFTKRSLALTLFALTLLITTGFAQEIPKGADPQAWNLLKEAGRSREVFPEGFTGCAAEIIVNDNGRIARGKLDYDTDGGATLSIDGLSEDTLMWAREQANSVLTHRRGGDFSKGDGRHPITFDASEQNIGNPIGRRVVLNDKLKSSYRIRDNQVVEVDRTMGSDHFVITVLDTTPTSDGRFLPRHFIVNYFDAQTGALKRSESFTDRYQKIGGIWLPASRRVVFAENGTITTRIIEFHNPRLKTAGDQAAR
ncbi:MAG: DUF3386 family protein [Acidobacteriota bacterium]|nr:MAG: DUF3386 family protein [Acidobacteriota bacterium]